MISLVNELVSMIRMAGSASQGDRIVNYTARARKQVDPRGVLAAGNYLLNPLPHVALTGLSLGKRCEAPGQLDEDESES